MEKINILKKSQLSTKERFCRVLSGQDVDRVPFMKVFGGDNTVLATWEEEYPGIGRIIDKLLGFEGGYRGWQTTPVNFGLSGLEENIIIQENDESVKIKRGDGAVVIQNKKSDYHSHVVEYPVKEDNDWDRIKSRYLNPFDKNRIPRVWEYYVEMYKNRDFPLQLTYGGSYGFVRNMMGDENLCFAIYDNPKLVKDIINTYLDMCVNIWESLCKDVEFDLIEGWEDMASKTGCIVSPDTFNEFFAPSYIKIRDFANSKNIPIVLVDSDGYIDELVELMIKCGVNAMYPFEVGANCNVFKVLEKYKNIGAIGALEKNTCSMDEKSMDLEMEKAKKLILTGRCIPGPDHFVLENVTLNGYITFMKKLKQIILNTKF